MYVYIKVLDSNFKTGALGNGKVDVAAPKPDKFGHVPLNILVIGSDARSSSADCDLGGSCDGSAPHADVEMLLHVSADRSNASILSIPRDTRVDIPACTDAKGVTHPARPFQPITYSLNYNVPGCVVDTWEALTHIHIDHWVMVDFSGVVKMADAVGGVDVCTRQNVMDYQRQYYDGQWHEVGSHLELPAGTHKVTGVQALEWLRTRHAFEDGSDVGRAKAQHLYLNSLIRQMKSVGTIANPLKLNSLALAATHAVSMDHGLGSIEALSSLALDVNKVPSDRITTVTVPHHFQADPASPNNLPVVLNDSAHGLFAELAGDTPLDGKGAAGSPGPSATPAPSTQVDKAAVHLDVQNGSGVNHRGQVITDALAADGFTHAVRDTLLVDYGVTTLVYPSSEQAQAQSVAAALKLPTTALKSSASATGLTLQVGADWKSGTTFPQAAPAGGGLPTDAEYQTASDSSQCMDVNPAPYAKFAPGQTHYIYSWTGSTPPSVPQANG
ncbi:LCP family protein [Streptacidiphilus melanogenes]|uniref:LCP family protein n=1 Tax=Streptacidiphilus melanogenes TaxID=411235 RepID=UPI0006932579|nr:LCP family protein [Streptacidiphilus melanogenes]